LCLDFINTLDDRFSGAPKELLPGYIDLVHFGEESGALTHQQADRLSGKSVQKQDVAERARAHALRMREAMFEVFWAIVQKKPVPRAELSVLNGYVHKAAQHASLVPSKHHFEWKFELSEEDFEAPLWPIASSAADLLASDELQYVRRCASKTCEWLFLDESKNHRRRWCDMTKCGNRAKFQRFYSRKKKEEA
jgi:predicted RNA-binding Zn ribbon-like protein